MSWRERDYAGDEDGWRKLGRPGGDWRGLRPTFDNPGTWSLPLGKFAGIAVRVHIVFLILIVVWLLQASLDVGSATLLPMGLFVGSLVLMVFLHELGHCLACRWVGGQANEILMWPLGGLAFTQPPNHWRAHLVTVIGGPFVNLLFLMVLVPLLWLSPPHIFWGVALPNPLIPPDLLHRDVAKSWLMQTLHALNYVNLVLLLFNLLPMFPLDGGRILQTMLWPAMGYSRSMRLSVRVGYLGAIALGILGLVVQSVSLICIAAFGAFTCYVTHKQLEWTDSALGLESDEYAVSVYAGSADPEAANPSKLSRAQRRAARQAEQERVEAVEVDRILQKIADRGMDSLTRVERNLLKRVTDRKRREERR
jgi:stage IV sporulation protein FB